MSPMIFCDCRQDKNKKYLLLAVTDAKHKELKLYMGLMCGSCFYT